MTQRLHKFLGEAAVSLLRTPFEATLYPVVYDKDLAASHIKPFLVGDGRILSSETSHHIAKALMDEDTWEWQWVSRHMAMPQYIFALRSDEVEVNVVLDISGKKLGLILGGRVSARDLVVASEGMSLLLSIVGSPHEESQEN